MKTYKLILTALLLCLCAGIAVFLQKKNEGETRVSVKEAGESYIFKASFHPGLDQSVIRYTDSCAAVLQKEKANFRIQASEGELKITADKQLNSSLSMIRIKKMCQDISKVIIP